MSPIYWLLVFVLFCLASTFGLYLLSLLLAPVYQLIQQGRSASRIHAASSKLKAVDELIARHRPQEALQSLRRSILFDRGVSPATVDALKEHHQNVLSRCLVIAEELGSRAENIADVEQLFLERTELQVLYLKANESYRGLRFRRERAGKGMPSWSTSEFEQRLSQIKEALTRNSDALASALDRLFTAVGEKGREEIVYH